MAFYDFEAWTMSKGKIRRLEANEEALSLVKEKRSLYASIKKRRDRLIGHTLIHERLAGSILEGTVEGRKRKGWQRLEYVKQIIDDVGCNGYCEMRRLAQDRNGWKAKQTSLRTAD